MSEKIQYNKKIRKTKGSRRLLLKNGIQYNISITENIKHRFKTIKPFKIKKWIIKSVFLHDFIIADKIEIADIIKNNAVEQKSYDNAFALDIQEIYELHLTNRQYETFKRFLNAFELELNTVFSLQRKGKGLKTIIEFTIPEYIEENEE